MVSVWFWDGLEIMGCFGDGLGCGWRVVGAGGLDAGIDDAVVYRPGLLEGSPRSGTSGAGGSHGGQGGPVGAEIHVFLINPIPETT